MNLNYVTGQLAVFRKKMVRYSVACICCEMAEKSMQAEACTTTKAEVLSGRWPESAKSLVLPGLRSYRFRVDAVLKMHVVGGMLVPCVTVTPETSRDPPSDSRHCLPNTLPNFRRVR